MADDVIIIIRDLRKEAIERCRKRILEATQNSNKKPKKPDSDYGLTSLTKRQHGL